MNGTPATISIHIGAPIDQEPERKFLTSLIEWLEDQEIPSVILANVHLGGRQIDCVVATASTTRVIEIKSSYLPVRGQINGDWERLDASGMWRPYTNAYQQALGAKNALRDSMTNVKPAGDFYPSGHVVFTHDLAEGSQVTPGDYKVQVTTLDRFLRNLKAPGKSPWSLEDWQSLAAKLALIKVSREEVATSREHRHSAWLLRMYSSAFVAEYGTDGNRWFSENPEQRNHLITAAASGVGCFITGPSGCGKTLMAKWVATDLAAAGNPTLFFTAKELTGSWADAVRREIALLLEATPTELFRAISYADRPTYLVLDGINELGMRLSSALRGIRALARRLGARLIVTGQGDRPAELSGLQTLRIDKPSIDLKNRIARANGSLLSPTAEELLKAVNSGIEAAIVGQIGSSLEVGSSRVILIDQYVRQRLLNRARGGGLGLRRFAISLHEQVAFSMSEVTFDELMNAHGVKFGDCDALVSTGLLVRRAGRVSFSHEMVQNACTALELARNAAIDPVEFGLKLSTPLFERIAGDAISVIEDLTTCRTVMSKVTSPALLLDAFEGVFGSTAASVAANLLDEAAAACVREIQTTQLALIEDDNQTKVRWSKAREWTDAERGQLSAIGYRAASGVGVDTYLQLCEAIDGRLATERRRLAARARELGFPLRSQSFALAYLGFGNEIGFTVIARACRPGSGLSQRRPTRQFVNLVKLSSGQLYFYLENRHTFLDRDDDKRLAEELICLLRERFRWEPYHVQLALLYAVRFAYQAPADVIEKLVEAINALEISPANWSINSSVVDALKALGAVADQDDSVRNQIKEQLDFVLSGDEENAKKDLALSLCVNMFDHPFDSIYGEEIYGLDEANRRLLYRRALGASDIKSSMSLIWLGSQVASFDDTMDVRLFLPLATLPNPSNPFAQEEWGGFVLATRFLARHGAKLPAVDREDPASRCLAEFRTLIYAAESKRQSDVNDAQQAWQRIEAMPVQLVIGCLSEVQSALADWRGDGTDQKYPPMDLIKVYPECTLNAARRFVDEARDAQYFRPGRWGEGGIQLAFKIVERHGDRSDIARVRRLTRGHAFARYAIATVKVLDAFADRIE
jgi:hypothetical protein